jgi:hypothetical protein
MLWRRRRRAGASRIRAEADGLKRSRKEEERGGATVAGHVRYRWHSRAPLLSLSGCVQWGSAARVRVARCAAAQ